MMSRETENRKHFKPYLKQESIKVWKVRAQNKLLYLEWPEKSWTLSELKIPWIVEVAQNLHPNVAAQNEKLARSCCRKNGWLSYAPHWL